MAAIHLAIPETEGRTVRLSRTEARTLSGFQRSAYAKPMKEILLKLLDDSRIHNESNPATEENRLRVQAVKEVVETLFAGKVELE